MKSKSDWENRYLEGTTGWDRGEASPNLLYWLESKQLKPCRILVPGCGNGHEVLILAKLGFDVVALDIAPSPVANLKKALSDKQLNAEVIQTDFFAWNAEKPFDAIYEQTSLCALEPSLWKNYEALLYGWLTESGKLFAQFMQTTEEGGPPFHCDVAAMRDLFISDRWQWSDEHETQVIHSENKHEKIYLLEKQL